MCFFLKLLVIIKILYTGKYEKQTPLTKGIKHHHHLHLHLCDGWQAEGEGAVRGEGGSGV